jgi:ribosomal-protein-alanine N-acetyltransferase
VIERFETERLEAWRPSETSGSLLEAIFGDPRTAATLGGIRSAEQSTAILRRFLAHWVAHGYGPWIITQRGVGWPIGYAGLLHTTEGAAGVELLYAFLPDAWGHGYATEAARAVVHLAFADLGLTELVASMLVTNRPSQRVVERCGFRLEREMVRQGLSHRLYRLRAAEWAARDTPNGDDRGQG